MLKDKMPLVIALVLGLLAALISHRTMKRQEEKIKEGWNLVPIVVASRDISEGSSLEWDMVAEHQIPEQFASSSLVEPKQIERVIGQQLMVPLQKGDPIMWSHFRTDSSASRLSNIVNKAWRAISIPIGGANAVSGMVRPNDHVDIIATLPDEKRQGNLTVTLMQDILVLAIDQITSTTNINLLDDSKKNFSTITVMVMPEEAELLALASQMGRLHLTLRNPEDPGTLEQRTETTIQTLITGERAKEMQIKRRGFVIVKGASAGTGNL
jgi:pilus assembly protein CpaB